jgi:hypothetical protein
VALFAALFAQKEVVNEVRGIGIRIGGLGCYRLVMVLMLSCERDRRRCRGQQECEQQSEFAHETSSNQYGSSPRSPIVERAYSGQDNVGKVSKSCTNTLRDFAILTDH